MMINLRLLLLPLFHAALLINSAFTPAVNNAPESRPFRAGKDFALFFAVSDYDHWTDLQNPVTDAEAIAAELESAYGFTTEIVRNPTYDDVIATLDRYTSERSFSDDGELFVFFTGHGYLNPLKEGFFIPKDGRKNDSSQKTYLLHSRIANLVNNIPCRHILLGIDACYSGSFMRTIRQKGNPGQRPGDTPATRKENQIQELLKYKSRLVITSGGEEPTRDDSQFFRQILAALRSKGGDTKTLDFYGLVSFLQQARPLPRHGEFGDNEPGGQFLFIYNPEPLRQPVTVPQKTDSDYDGTPDDIDACPQLYGTSKANGCPDADNDGVPDHADSCRYLAGEIRWQGCPDTDGDGIPDHQDRCPNQKGTAADRGCPPADRDNDGIPDKTDACPDQAGKAAFQGCPDTDNDGVPDKNDKCPDKAGNPNMQGCPDSDNDRIPDHEDQCPFEKGELNRQGCPPPDPMNLAYIKGGSFQMGSDEESDETPKHTVTLGDFYIGKYEVTRAQWRSVMGANPPELFNKGCDQCPVENVSWDDVQTFIQKLNRQTGRQYRLPTEAEWEYAAGNGPKHLKYSWGNGRPAAAAGGNLADETAKKSFPEWSSFINGFNDGFVYTAPVGKFGANEFGLYDMTGNVWEWCSDVYLPDFYSKSPVSNPQGPAAGNQRVLRGGSWNSNLSDCRVSNRNAGKPDKRSNLIGFRLARTP